MLRYVVRQSRFFVSCLLLFNLFYFIWRFYFYREILFLPGDIIFTWCSVYFLVWWHTSVSYTAVCIHVVAPFLRRPTSGMLGFAKAYVLAMNVAPCFIIWSSCVSLFYLYFKCCWCCCVLMVFLLSLFKSDFYMLRWQQNGNKSKMSISSVADPVKIKISSQITLLKSIPSQPPNFHYYYLCNQYLPPLKLWVIILFMARYTWYNNIY